jgi:hypothetical protein
LIKGILLSIKATAQEHWRNEFTGRKQIQCFLQYVRVDGPASWLKWDTRPSLGLPYDYVGPAVKSEVEQVMARDKLSAKR